MNVGNLKKNFLLTTWISALLILLIQADAFSQSDPFIPKYNAIKRSERCFTITEDANNQFGAVWFRNRGNFDQDTTLYFVVYMGDKDGSGADGMAFVMHDDPRDTLFDGSVTYNIGGQTFNQQAATGEPGGGLGYGNHHSQGHNLWISPSVAVEFDTWDNNPDVLDGNAGDGLPQSPFDGDDHTSVVYNGDMENGYQMIEDADGNLDRMQLLLPPSNPDWAVDPNIEDNGCYAYRINWIVNPDGTQTLELWADEYDPDIIDANNYTYHLVMRHTDDMINNVFGGVTNLRFGFTGSTGGSRNEQTICLLGGNTRPVAMDDYANTSVNTTVNIDVESNDQDFDGDNLFVPTIVRAPDNGTATVISVGNANMIEYTPNANFVGTDTIQYRTCDVDSDKCYALCDLAYAIVTVGCDPFFITADSIIAPYTVCVDTFPANGAANASFLSGSLRGNIWVETFTGMNNATVDNGSTPWSFTTSGSCASGNTIQVQNGAFRARKTGCEVVWETGDIDISAANDINVSMFLYSEGDMESSDYLEVYYILDGGAEVPLTNGIFTDNFGNATASAVGLEGNTLKIRVYARNSGGDENYEWDDLYITGTGAGFLPNLTFNWYEGSVAAGNLIGTGATMADLRDTTYYVYATDPITGCRSDTVSVTVPNAAQAIPEDSIVIQQVAPFTKCTLPYDGHLKGYVFENGDTVTAGYLFEWRYLTDPGGPVHRTGSDATQLEADDFILTVMNNATGCSGTRADSVENKVVPPVITPVVVSHVFSCDDPNSGVARVTAEIDNVPVTSGISFLWYEGLIADITNPYDHIGDTIDVLKPDQDYAIKAYDSLTGCTSATRTLHIDDLRNNPVAVVTSAADQISCDPSNPTGAFTAAVDEGGSNVTAGYTFNWYRGLNDVTPAKPGYTGGPDVDVLPADQYRLIVENDLSGCFSILDTAIIENITYPEIDTATVTHVDICGSNPNGTITVTPVGNINDYNYRYYTGLGVVPANLIAESASNTRTGLAMGNYTVTIVDKITLCASPSRSVNIADSTKLPEATFVTSPQISCDPANPTGRITTTVSQKTAVDHTFEWFVNDTTGASVSTTSGTNGKDAIQLAVGTYVLRLTDNTSNCFNVYPQNIGPNIVNPVIDTAYSVPSVNCAPVFNGELLATADGGQTDPSIFTFTWRNASNVIISTDAHPINIAPGDYRLIVTNDTTTCNSSAFPVTVNDEHIDPDPEIAATDNSSCDVANPNGELEVTDVTNEGAYDPANYSFEWYFTNSSGTQLVTPSVSFPNSPDSSHVFGLSEETYALVITNKATNCSNEVLSSITDINIKPVLDYPTITDATRCTEPYMSSVVATVNGGLVPPGYSFMLENVTTGDVFTNTTGIFNDNVAGDGLVLPPGTEYRLIGLNDFNCPSDTIEFEIGDDSTDPVFSLSTFDNTSCEVTLPNGIIVASTDGSFTISSIEWFVDNTSGSNVDPTKITRDDSVAVDLLADDYAVRMTADNGCTSVELATIDDVVANKPLIDSLYAENLTSCVIDNGLIGLGVSPLEQIPPDLVYDRTYTFQIDNSGTIFSRSTEASHRDSVNFVDLAQGDWVATVEDNFTHCISDPITVSLLNAPEIVFNVNIINKPSGCAANTGELEISAETPGFNESPGGAGFDFSWFEGATTAGAAVGTVNPIDDWTSSADQLVAGYYTIEVFDRTSQCVKDTAVFLNRILPPLIETPITTNSTQCNPANGGLEITIDPVSFPVGIDYSGYDYLLFEGVVFDENWTTPGTTEYQVIEGPTIVDPVNGPVTFASTIEAGTYIVIARERFGLDHCFTDPQIVEIDLDYQFPDLDFTIVPDNTCAGAANGTGSVEEINLTHADYDFQWYSGSSILSGSPLAGETSEIIIDKLSGSYTLWLEVTAAGAGLGCDTVKTVQIPKVKDDLQIVANITPNYNCTPNFNGIIEITDVLTDSNPTGLAGFDSFTIKNSSNIDITGTTSGDGTATPWSDLTPASYYLTARNVVTNCITKSFKADVDDDSEKPTLNLVMDSPDYSCNDLFPTGEISASASPAPTGSFTWSWTDSGGNPVVSTDNPVTSSAVNLADDIYTIVVTDNDGDGVNEGCSTSRDFTLTQGSISIVTPVVLHTDRTICADNASITVNQIEEKRNSIVFNTEAAPYSVYEAVLHNSDLTPVNTGVSSWAIFQSVNGKFGATDEIPVGTYYVKARNTLTGCDFGPPKQVIIKDVSKKPVVKITMQSPDFACSPSATHTGVLSTVAVGGSDSDGIATNFSYVWTDLANNPIPTDAGTPPQAINLPEGEYKLVVTDNTGLDQFCSRTQTFEVSHALQEIVIVAASGTDQTWCRPNGMLQVDSLVVNGAGVGPSDPQFSNYGIGLFVGDLTTSFGSGDNAGLPGDPIDSISANTYFALATNVLTECVSQPRQVLVRDRSQDPLVNLSLISPNYSLNYGNTNSLTGILEADATEVDGSKRSQGYEYKWYRNEVNNDSLFFTSGLSTAAQTEQNLRDAVYFVEVMSDTSGCISTAAIDLPFVYLKPKFNPVVTAQTFCAPLNGKIEIPSIYKVQDSTETKTKYEFFWHVGDYDVTTPEYVQYGGLGGDSLVNIAANDYYIQALDTFWLVQSDPVKVTVLDSTTFPQINFNASLSDRQTSCNPATPNGALSVLMGGLGLDTYAYRWFEGNDTTSTPIGLSETIVNREAGNYTVKVTSLTTQCISTKTFSITDDMKMPVVAVSSSPVTNCVPANANGIASANIINTVNSTYDFYWYPGDSDAGSPSFTDLSGLTTKINSSYTNLPAGFYTVVAQDTFDCRSIPTTVEVKEDLRYPRITWEELSPLTHCDPAKANAVFSAKADGTVVGYTFHWNVKDGPLYNEGPVVNNLGSDIYRLVVTNNVTGCSSFEDIKATEAYLNIPSPIPSVLNDRTSCIAPDGEAMSDILGKIEHYYFTYLGIEQLDSLTNPRNGTEISELDINNYLVFATDRTSGCVSDSVLFVIKDARYVPDYDVISEPSTCVEPTGSAEVILSDIIRPFEVRWYEESGFPLGITRSILYQPSGVYYVAVEGTEGCIDSARVEIGTDLVIYNGVSANDDGLNDVFHIECLDLFPNNNVKIFNRAGELVYEMRNYDTYNFDKSFGGASNRGPVNGNKLAIGTYFYVIDKGDGTKPLVGYLELTR